ESTDAALVASFPPGTLTVHASGSERGSGAALLEIYDTESDASAWLGNLSARARIGSGSEPLIAGFMVRGHGSLRLLARGIGPGLAQHGVATVLADPVLHLYRRGNRIASNDDWSADPAESERVVAAAATVGAFPLAQGSRDAAMLLTLPEGVYSLHLAS